MARKIKSDEDLTFIWKAGEKRLLYILLIFPFALILHILGFYLFKVSYPSSQRFLPKPRVLGLISSKSPQNKQLLAEIADANLYTISTLNEDATAINPKNMTFNATYKKLADSYRPEIASLPEPNFFDLDSRFIARELLLDFTTPPTPESENNVPEAPHISEHLLLLNHSMRKILSAPQIRRLPEAKDQAQSVAILLGVTSSGRVKYAFPLETLPSFLDNSICQLLETDLLFEPTQNLDLQWLELELL